MVGGGVKTVLWSVDEKSREVRFEGASLRVVDKYGLDLDISDGSSGDGDNAVNGEISLTVGGSPIYVSALAD